MRPSLAVLLVAGVAVCVACGTPPDKEMNQARGAIESAKAAGAPTYATDEYNAAVAALKRSEDAVGQRDYRQALNAALDSRERAQVAAREASDQKALARSQAERDLHDVQTLIDDAAARAKAAETARPKRRAPLPERTAIGAAEVSVQKARAAFGQQDYLGARDAIKGVSDQLRAAIRQIEQAAAPPPPKRRR
jgi:flagellar hook-basal body complex protein FliE